MTSAVLGAGCSPPSAPEAGNIVQTAPPTTLAPTTVPPTTQAPDTTRPAPISTTEPVFVPPSTTLPEDPDLREAIRVRVAVEAEYRRQARAGIADAKGFEGLADPDTWLVPAIDELTARSNAGIYSVAQTTDGVVALSARFQSENEIVLEVCHFNDDVKVDTKNTPSPDDDSRSGGLDVETGKSLLTRKGGKWLYSGSAFSPGSSC